MGATGQGLLVEVDYALGAAETRRQIMLGVDGVPLGCLYDGVPGPQGAGPYFYSGEPMLPLP